jgi:hypothetical protein
VDHSPARAARRLAHVAVVSAKIQKDCGAMLHLSSTVNKAQHVSFFFPEKQILSPKHPLFCEKHIFTATAYIFGEKHTKS